MIKRFLADTQQLTGTTPENAEAQRDHYVESILSSQKIDPECCMVLESFGCVIGFIDAHPSKADPKTGVLSFNYVILERRGEGFGRLLIDYALRILRRLQCLSVRLNVAKTNQKAILIYKKYGWEFNDEEKGDFFVMRRSL